MKIALNCKSLLIEKSLELMLKSYIVSKKQCDFLISDHEDENKDLTKPIFYIDTYKAHICKPFSKEELLEKLQKFHDKHFNLELEEKIEFLTKDFSSKLVKIIQDYYEK